MKDTLHSLFRTVAQHNLAVVVLMLVLTGGVAAGIPQLDLGGGGGGGEIAENTQTVQKASYVQEAYVNETRTESNTTVAVVYVRAKGGNALSKSALVRSLEYQQTVLNNSSVAGTLRGDAFSVANVIGTRAAGSPDATVAEQLSALRQLSPSEVQRLVETTLTENSPALQLLPTAYEPGTAQAESHRMVFRLSGDGATTTQATHALYDATTDTANPTLFTLGEHARQATQPGIAQLMNLLWLVVPFALGTILVVLAFVYRDPVDVVVGFLGIVVSLLWTFGLLGWLQIPAGLSVVIAPVLVIGLSVDYGLHVFMRYREERGADEELRAPMARSTTRLTSALSLVTLTAVVGFAVNVVSPLSSITQLALGIILGVVSAFVLSVTFVPAAKITVDSLLERVGVDRRKRPLGESRLLEPVLVGGARLAKRAAPAVLIVGLVLGGLGGAAWVDLDRKPAVDTDTNVADWKKNLPDPIGWTTPELQKRSEYVRDTYRAVESDERRRSALLIEPTDGDAARPAVLDRVRVVHEQASDRSVVFARDGTVPVISPLTVMRAVANRNEAFAEQFQAADTDGDGVPERNVASLYDALFAAAPAEASRVIDRTADGYASVRVIVPIEPDAGRVAQGETMRAFATAVETDTTRVTAVGTQSVNVVRANVLADAIVETMVLALLGVTILLVIVYRLAFDSASLGVVTAVPIAVVTALVIGGMWLLDVPLTINTTLLLSIVIGLGIDYNIHVSDRAIQELERGASLPDALTAATTGTGGALLGSTLTTVAAFSALLIAPFQFFQSFGTLVALALIASFVVAVFFLPSLVALWHRYVFTRPDGSETVSMPSDD